MTISKMEAAMVTIELMRGDLGLLQQP